MLLTDELEFRCAGYDVGGISRRILYMSLTRPFPCRAAVNSRAMWSAVSSTLYRHSARRQQPKTRPSRHSANIRAALHCPGSQKDRPFSSEVRHEAVGVPRRRLRTSSLPAGPSNQNGVPPCRHPPGGVRPTGVPLCGTVVHWSWGFSVGEGVDSLIEVV